VSIVRVGNKPIHTFALFDFVLFVETHRHENTIMAWLHHLINNYKQSMQSGTTQTEIQWEFSEKGNFEKGLEQWETLHTNYGLPVLINAKSLKIALAHFGKGNERFAFGFQSNALVAITVVQGLSKGKYRLFQPEQVPLCFYLGPKNRDILLDLRSLLQSLPLWVLALGINVLDETVFSFQNSYAASRIANKYETAFIELPDTSDGYLGTLSPRFQHDLRRRTRKAEAEIGEVYFSVCDAPSEIPELVNLYADMESAGWKAQSGTAVVREGQQAKFYSDWLKALAEDGCAAVFSLRIGDQPAAMRLCAFDQDALYILKVSHNENLKAYGPGALHMQRLIQHIYANVSKYPKKIEYYGKLAESQKHWMTGSRFIRQATTYRSQSLLTLLNFNAFGLLPQRPSTPH
jgi:hypothetical protein